jgi:hypothetical protein
VLITSTVLKHQSYTLIFAIGSEQFLKAAISSWKVECLHDTHPQPRSISIWGPHTAATAPLGGRNQQIFQKCYLYAISWLTFVVPLNIRESWGNDSQRRWRRHMYHHQGYLSLDNYRYMQTTVYKYSRIIAYGKCRNDLMRFMVFKDQIDRSVC